MVYERYHIPIRTMPHTAPPVPKFVITRASNCVNCGKCEKACIFGVHKRSELDPREMADPLSHLCKNCFRCIADCPQRALTMSIGEEYKSLGGVIWTPLRISTMWGESETGKIPVLGAGFRGMFAGPNYDGMWTDMSEIVRPTRDGIHGREFISTSVDIGRKPLRLEFDSNGGITTQMSPIVELSIPMVLDVTRVKTLTDNLLTGYAMAADALDTLLFVPDEMVTEELHEIAPRSIVPVFPDGALVESIEVDPRTRMIELDAGYSWKAESDLLSRRFPDKVISFRLKAGRGIEDKALEMTKGGIQVLRVDYTEDGTEHGQIGIRHARDSLLAIHRKLTSESIRDSITIIAGGGIAAAEHVPKTIVCGADAVALEKALLISLSCRDCGTCAPDSCPASIRDSESEWIEGRVSNLVGAWRDQMLEVLGAMGLREVRRLRGEVGRAIFFEDIEKEFQSTLSGGDAHG